MGNETLTDAERVEILNLLQGAVARHLKARGLVFDTWMSAIKKLAGTDKIVRIEVARS